MNSKSATELNVVEDTIFAKAFRGSSYTLHPAERRVRAEFRGRIVADSERAVFYIDLKDLRARGEDIRNNQYWLGSCEYMWPLEDVDHNILVKNGRNRYDERIGYGSYYDISVGGKLVENAAWVWDGAQQDENIKTYICIANRAVDALYEEEDQVVGPRNPFHSAEVRHSSRHVVIEIDGAIVAETTQARILYETGLPPRYYIPRQDLKMRFFKRTDARTTCPYKGESIYWSVKTKEETFENIAWSYERPFPNVCKLEHLIGFYEERGAYIVVDGTRRELPKTGFPKTALLLRHPVKDTM